MSLEITAPVGEDNDNDGGCALPDEIVVAILSFLPCAILRGRAAGVCAQWRRIVEDPTVRTLCVSVERKLRLDASCSAARAGHLACMRFARRTGFYWGRVTCAMAAAAGRLDCLAYARRHGCEMDDWTYIRAAQFGHLCVLEYLVGQNPRIGGAAAGTVGAAIARGQVDCLRFLHDVAGCRLPEDGLAAAAESGHLDCMVYIHHSVQRNGGRQDMRHVCDRAAARGRLDCLAYAHSIGCRWDATTCAEAAKGGWVDCLAYAHENGCDWDYHVVLDASRSGHAACLDYATRHGCPAPGALVRPHDPACRACIERSRIPVSLAAMMWHMRMTGGTT